MANALVYSSILLLIGTVASISYHPTSDNGRAGNVANLGAIQTAGDATRPSVDQLAVANLAAKTAAVADLAVANDVSSASITLSVKNELAQQDEAVITKPQTFEPTSSSAITSYKVVAGDTVQLLATKYGVSDQTIKWANNLTTDVLIPGTEVLVPTTDGVVYVVKPGDTVDTIAAKYQSDKARIVSKNDLEISGIVAGQRIVLPGGVLPQNERPGYVAPRVVTSTTPVVARSSNPAYAVQAGNRYAYGNCTWYAYNRRMQIGRPVGSFWGNASSWSYAAAMSGYVVNHVPGVGDVMQNGGGAGHIAVVEEVRADGSIRVSEMNYYANGGGWNIISYRVLDAGAAAAYNFIK